MTLQRQASPRLVPILPRPLVHPLGDPPGFLGGISGLKVEGELGRGVKQSGSGLDVRHGKYTGPTTGLRFSPEGQQFKGQLADSLMSPTKKL